MPTEKIIIANLKCGGCENTIKNKISELKGVISVAVNADEDLVTVEFDSPAKREDFTKKLHSLGYPEVIENVQILK